MNFSASSIIAGILFGGVGFVAFAYGKKMASWRAMGLGAILMVYPYFIQNTFALYGIGILLTVGLFFP